MPIFFLFILALLIAMTSILFMYNSKVRYRLMVMATIVPIFLLVRTMEREWKPMQRMKAIYPCDLTSQEGVDQAAFLLDSMAMKADTTIMDFDPMTLQCGDTVYSYLLLRTFKNNMFYLEKTKTVISRTPLKEGEQPIIDPWLYGVF